jgi:hypothetical protein
MLQLLRVTTPPPCSVEFACAKAPAFACFTATIYVYNRHARKIRLLTLQDFSAGVVFALWDGVMPLQHVF